MKKAEIIIASISIIALGMSMFSIPGADTLIVLSLTALLVIYFYFSFALFNNIRLREIFKKESYTNISKKRIVGAIGAGFALSAVIAGLMFKFQSWPGADFNLIVGLIGLSIVTIVGFAKYSINKSNFYKRIFKRVLIFGGLGFILALTPKTTWIDVKYRNYPEYKEALKKALANPENKELWENVEEERYKMRNQ